MTSASFAPTAITINGATFPADYSVTPAGTVFAFVTIQEDGKPVNMRIRFDRGDEHYSAALEAALQSREPALEPEQPEEQPQPEPEQPADLEQAEAPAEAEQPIRAPKQARGPVPEKLFVGLEIKGRGWKIVFDGCYDRTRVIFQRKPSREAADAVKQAGFYWSPTMKSWNKKLTHRAFRAAQALAQQLETIVV